MAEKRMFAKSIVLSDVFLEMPMSARCLYFTLGMLADDDGFIGNHKSIMRMCGATEDDLKVLLAKRYILQFESGVVVIKHWRINNYLRLDRHSTTTYVEELNKLKIDEKGAYTDKNIDGIPNGNQMTTNGIPSIDKNSIEENNINNSIGVSVGKKRFVPPDIEEVKAYIKIKNLEYVNAEDFVNFYESKNWYVGKNKMTNWKSALSGWNSRKKPEKLDVPKYNEKDLPTIDSEELNNLLGGRKC